MSRQVEICDKPFVTKWSIKEFFSLPVEVDSSCEGPLFSFANESWWLIMYPNGKKEYTSEGYIDLFLCRESSGARITVECTLGIETVDGKLDAEAHFTNSFDNTRCFGPAKFISRSKLLERKSDFLPSDTLTVVCKMKLPEFKEYSSVSDTEKVIQTKKCSYCDKTLDDQEDIQSHFQECEDLPIKCQKCSEGIAKKNWYHHKCHMTDAEGTESSSGSSKFFLENKVLLDYKELFLKQKGSDVVIRVKGQEFSAHKSILTARSPVFESTFRNDMKEKETGIVDIEDCDPSSFSDFLCFLYCGDTGTLSEENVFSLFTTADKYDVQDLRDICLRFMKENISIDTFCDAITLALQYCETELITLATDFFTKNARKITKTVQWQRFVAANPIQSNELIIKMLEATAEPNE